MALGRHLEHIERQPAGAAHAVPLLFVHGAYTGAWCWDEHFLPFFARHGYAAHAVSLSGHGGSDGREVLDSLKLDDYVADVAEAIRRLPTPPVLIGHSMGGLVVQKYLEQAAVPAAALLCSVPPHGLAPSAMQMMWQDPSLLQTLNAILTGSQPSRARLRDALFNQPPDNARLARYARHFQPESMRALWDMTAFNLPQLHRMHRVPLLILGAAQDRLILPADVVATGLALGQPAEILPELGHAVMLERGWEAVATRILSWLETLPLHGDAA